MTNNLQELTSANNHATLEVSFLQLLMMIMMTTMMIVTILIRLVTQGPPFREAVYLAEGYPLHNRWLYHLLKGHVRCLHFRQFMTMIVLPTV